MMLLIKVYSCVWESSHTCEKGIEYDIKIDREEKQGS
jgi:hypothetical protein